MRTNADSRRKSHAYAGNGEYRSPPMRLRSLAILGAVVLVVPPLIAFAMSSTSQEYLEAVNAKPDLDRGAHYFTTCANCHGARGGGSVDGRIPRIGGQYFRVIVRQL